MALSWKPVLERALVTAASALRLDAVGRRLHRHAAVAVMYHGFTAGRSQDGIQNHEGKHLHADAFRAHVEFLNARYTVIPLGDLVRAAASGAPLPPRPAVITIDDGYRSIYTVAYPILREAGVPAAVFLATEFVHEGGFLWTDRVEHALNRTDRRTLSLDVGAERLTLDLASTAARRAADRRVRSALKRLPQDARAPVVDALERTADRRLGADARADALYQPLSWSEVREMAESGLVSFGSHTHTHVIVSRCSEKQAREELAVSKRIIEEQLGRPCELFCYPNGRRGDFNAETRRWVRDAGYGCALTTVYGMNPAPIDVYELKRYNLGKPLSPGEMRVRLSGLLS